MLEAKLRRALLPVLFLAMACGENLTESVDLPLATDGVLSFNGDGVFIGPVSTTHRGLVPSFSLVAASPAAGLIPRAGVVLPAEFETLMASSNNVFPHSVADMRYQQVFLGTELGGHQRIGGLCLRPDDEVGSSGGAQEVTVKLGPTDRDLLTIGSDFDANYSSPPTTVYSGEWSLPETGPGGVDDWKACLEFSEPFDFVSGNLIVEIINLTAEDSVWPADYCQQDPGCNTTRVWAMSATASSGLMTPNRGLVMKFLFDPATKDDCKVGGWESFGFKDQGQCVRFIETGLDSRSGE